MNAFFDGMALEIKQGDKLLDIASEAWANASDRQREQVMWDLPMARRRAALANSLGSSPLACALYGHGDSVSLAWAIPNSPNSRTACLHLFCSGDTHGLRKAATRYLVRAAKKFSMLYCMIPAPYIGVARLLAALGFYRAISFPHACHMFLRQRNVDGVMWVKTLRG